MALLLRSHYLAEPLIPAITAADIECMSLLDYAASQLGGHPDWPEVRPSVWHELPALADLDPVLSPTVAEALTNRLERTELHLSISVPAPLEYDMPHKAPQVNYCGGCFQRFVAMDAVTAANALRRHIEVELCAPYVATTDA
jgi:hypothetical protein